MHVTRPIRNHWFESATINMTQHDDGSSLRHLHALYNKRIYLIHIQVYLFVQVNVHLSIRLTVNMHI